MGSFILAESGPLAGLKEVNRRLIRNYISNLKPGTEITLDVDTQLIETTKSEAKSGCVSQGETIQEAMTNIKEAIELYLESFKERKLSLPRIEEREVAV